MRTPSHKVLVVEADDDLQRLLVALLTEEGYEAQVVTTLPAALEALQAGQPALVLLDMDQFEDQGEGLARRIKAEYGEGLPVVIVGPRYEASTLAEAVGADAALSKPFDIDTFIDLLARLTRGGK